MANITQFQEEQNDIGPSFIRVTFIWGFFARISVGEGVKVIGSCILLS